MLYHVVANLEKHFVCAEDAIDHYRGRYLFPRIPQSRMSDEDDVTPRICAAESVEDCFTGIGLPGRFRRCLGGNDGAYSYATDGREVYPILILEFDIDFEDTRVYYPTVEEVPDVEMTREVWITESIIPDRVSLVWLAMDSIFWRSEEEPNVCVDFYTISNPNPKLHDHPWLNGRGHPLESSEPESYYDFEQEPKLDVNNPHLTGLPV